MSQLSPAREEYEVQLQPLTHVPLERELPLGQRLWQQGWLRKSLILLLLALVWFGLGQNSLIFVLVHSVLWALALNMYAGLLGVSETLRMAGRNYGLKGLRFVLFILIPAALPSILAGLKIGWAFA